MTEFKKGDAVRIGKCIDLETGEPVRSHLGCVEKRQGIFSYIVRIFTHRRANNKPLEKAKCKGRIKFLLDDDTFVSEPKFKAEIENLKKVKGYYHD